MSWEPESDRAGGNADSRIKAKGQIIRCNSLGTKTNYSSVIVMMEYLEKSKDRYVENYASEKKNGQ